MRFRIPVMLLLAAGPFLAQAQSPSNNAFAITSKIVGGHEWTEVKQINLSNGQIIKNVFDNNIASYNLYDGRSARTITVQKQTDSSKESAQHPFAGLSAACAYDAKMNRLYYVPLFINQLRYIDLSNSVPSVYLFQSEKFSNAADPEAEASQVTRMVIASDGNGYAMSNNGMHLIRFTTDKNPVITDLGAVHDAAENGEISIHDANTSWGGDMLADAGGNLYVISALNHVFRINIQTKSATFITKIKQLPVGFTTNGAVVDEAGKIVLSSAHFLTAYYQVDPETWEATAIQAEESVYNTSDLANEKLLFETKLTKNEDPVVNEKISVYPNPVKSGMFRVSFDNKKIGNYDVQLIDVAGRMVSDKALSVFKGTQVSEVRLKPSVSRGIYLVKVLSKTSKEIYLKKILVQ